MFPGCFTLGFEPGAEGNEFQAKAPDLIVPCFHADYARQLCAMDDITLEEQCRQRGITNAYLMPLLDQRRMRALGAAAVYELLCALAPRFHLLKNAFNLSLGDFMLLTDIQLTSVGIALASANLRIKVGLGFDLETWI